VNTDITAPCCGETITVHVEFDRADPSVGYFHDTAWCEDISCPSCKKEWSDTEQEQADYEVVAQLDADDYYSGPDTTAEAEGWV